jgi:hypothetical protein
MDPDEIGNPREPHSHAHDHQRPLVPLVPEGGKIVFRSGIGNGLGSDAGIWVINVDGSGTPTNVSSSVPGSAWPDWGPAVVRGGGYFQGQVRAGPTTALEGGRLSRV